jgi:hypothetical protein
VIGIIGRRAFFPAAKMFSTMRLVNDLGPISCCPMGFLAQHLHSEKFSGFSL